MSDLLIHVGGGIGPVAAILHRPPEARLCYVLAHGAGAGMHHRFMEGIAAELSAHRIATLRYQFPYMESGGRRPDPPAVLHATVRAAVAEATRIVPDLPLLAGGKSLGGRMTSGAAAREPLPGVSGLVFLGFPLHPAKRPATGRAEHLSQVALPMLFLQGTRDELADLDLITGVCGRLGPGATLHMVEGANHAFEVLKRSGRTGAEVMAELARAVAEWAPPVRDRPAADG